MKKIDTTRIVESGTTLPRPAAWHLAHGEGWKRDSVEQGFSTLLDLTPDPMDVLSVHVYEKAKEHYPEAGGTQGVIGLVMKQAQAVRKPLFIGEFPVKDQVQTQEYLHAMEANRVPLSAFWVFDDPNEPKMNVDFDNERSFVLDMVAKGKPGATRTLTHLIFLRRATKCKPRPKTRFAGKGYRSSFLRSWTISKPDTL